MSTKHPHCAAAGCVQLVPCPAQAGCNLEQRHHWCPDESGACEHNEGEECPAMMMERAI